MTGRIPVITNTSTPSLDLPVLPPLYHCLSSLIRNLSLPLSLCSTCKHWAASQLWVFLNSFQADSVLEIYQCGSEPREPATGFRLEINLQCSFGGEYSTSPLPNKTCTMLCFYIKIRVMLLAQTLLFYAKQESNYTVVLKARNQKVISAASQKTHKNLQWFMLMETKTAPTASSFQ